MNARLVLVLVLAFLAAPASAQEARWWRGNTHTHTLWSDGDAAPEMVVDWYHRNGYDFLVLSDHNQIQEGERWFPVTEGPRLTEAHVRSIFNRFGADQVELRETAEGGREMRLLTLAELEARFEAPGEFELIPGEEITAHWTAPPATPGERGVRHPVHVNAVNLAEYVPPRGADSVVDLMNATLAAVAEQAERLGRPILAHLNHPNYGWGVSWRDLAAMRHERFFEVYNGHWQVRNEGDETHPSTERMWDLANARRLTELRLPLLYGVAVDDAHNYYGTLTSQPGRGWVVVRATELSGDAIVEAMQRGDFYASSGVELEDVVVGDGRYEVHVAARDGIETTTRFVGTRRDGTGTGPVGEVLLETQENPAIYRFRGDELYVRAVVESSRVHPNPYRAGDHEMAWTQPFAR